MWALGMIICVVLGFLIGFYSCTLMVMKDRKELKRITEYCGGHVVDAGGYGFEECKKGKWIRVDSNTFKCSLCGNFLNFRGVNAGRGDANYCPNCGEKLEKEDNNV